MDYKGLRWYKCDFHLHTMSSLCYKNREKDTIDDWVEETISKGLQCIAITDHNDYRGIDGIKNKAESEGVIVFPGVELSCTDSKVHLLIIFNNSETGERVQEFLNQVGIFSDSLGKSEVTCNGDIFQVCEKAHSMGALVIAAHIDEFSGLCEISHDNLTKVLNREYIDAVQISNEEAWISNQNSLDWEMICSNLSEKYGKEISEEKAKKWHKAYELAVKSELPMLTFSDNPHSDGESKHGLWGIGCDFTWLKMDVNPDLESIRQALLSFDMRIKRKNECSVPPDMFPEMWIREIAITNTTLNDKSDIVVNFNPQLNAIIGGRGSGKSSIVRLLAGGMESFDAEGLSDITNEQDSFYQERKKDKSGIYKGVLKFDSSIRIFLERMGDSYRIDIKNAKSMHNQERILYKHIDGEWKEIEDSNYLDFFKAQIYTQKQIYEIAKDANSILNIIDEDISELNQMISDRDIAFDSVIANHLEVNNIQKSISEEGMILSELKDIEEQINKYEKSGISDALKEKQKFETQWKTVEDYVTKKLSWIEKITAVVNEINEKKDEITTEIDNEIALLIQENDKQFSTKLESIDEVAKAMNSLIQEFNSSVEKSEWNTKRHDAEDHYSDIVKELQSQGINLDRLDDLLEKKKSKLRDIDRIKEDKKRLVAAKEKQDKFYIEYESAVKKISEKRKEFICSVIGSDANVKFEIQKGRNRSSFIQMMKTVLGKENATIDENIEMMADLFFGRNGMTEFRKKVQEIRDGVDTKSYHARMRNAILELQPESFARMVYFIPEDDLRVSYRPENSKKYIPLSNASAGQKTTAILTFLLAYGDLPLLLDQPEDDLDNKLVYDLIVTRLKEAKSKRQIIVVTHNANIPVNADAEFIVSMDSESEQVAIKYEGTMDDKNVRKEICDVMEGTQFAFEMRAKKYHFRIVE